MRLISHRGNINGPNPEFENDPLYIVNTLKEGYECEVDVWIVNGQYYLGHDKPQYHTTVRFLRNNNLWCHAKNLNALYKMLEDGNIHCFWHQEDDVTLTSKGFIWTYPGKPVTPMSVIVLAGDDIPPLNPCYGICSDHIDLYKDFSYD